MTTPYVNPAIEILRSVAEALGEGWSVPEDAPTLIGPGGAHVGGWVGTYGSDKGRLELRGEFPTDRDGKIHWTSAARLKVHSISVRADRPPLAIAREIQRRLLPEYLAILPGVIAEADRCVAAHRTAAALREEMVETLKPLSGNVYLRESRVRSYDRNGVKPSVTVDVRNYGHVEVKVESLTHDQLRKLATFLTTL